MDIEYGSDVVVEALVRHGIEHIAINPGASFRGLHESLVAAGSPQVIETLNENVAVAIAHGYAKSAGKPMAVGLHNLVGLQTGAMGIFNAWADQVPMLVLGGSGPADQTQRRPWIDWIHTTRMQSLIVRDYVKWDDQPVSVAAFPESIARAMHLSTAMPQGPSYVAVDAILQETPIPAGLTFPPTTTRFGSITAAEDDLAEIAMALVQARRPVILADYTGRSRAAFDALCRLSELLPAPVVDLGARFNFPNTHDHDFARHREHALRSADVVLALDPRDLRWALSAVNVEQHSFQMLTDPSAKLFSIGLTDLMSKGFIDLDAPMDGDLLLTADTGVALPTLTAMVEELLRGTDSGVTERADYLAALRATRPADPEPVVAPNGEIAPGQLMTSVWEAVRGGPWVIGNMGRCPSPNFFSMRRFWELDQWNCHLGRSGGGGLGYGLGASIGAGLGRPDPDQLVINLQADGDALETPSALWTAAHHRIPVLFVVVNNRMYAQERMHQSILGRLRGREHPATTAVDISDPDIDFAAMARSQGVQSWGPVAKFDELDDTLRRAADTVRTEQRPALVDVVVRQ